MKTILGSARGSLNFLPRLFQVRYANRKLPHPLYYQFRRPSQPHEIAKEFFDGLYAKRFGKHWPSMRCAMLSRKKYAAILNNFTDTQEVEEEFLESGAVDVVGSMRDMAKAASRNIETAISEVEQNMYSYDAAEAVAAGSHQSESNAEGPENQLKLDMDRLNWLKKERDAYQDIAGTCSGLKVYIYPRSDLTEFDDPLLKKRSGPILDYFLLDGSSILPILALNPQPQEHILDTCAAPGGKLMCIMQLCEDGSGSITANDISKPRVSRIHQIQEEYIPKDSALRRRMKLMNLDMTTWEDMDTDEYDKVLVDVPCTADRYSFLPSMGARDNIFSQLRKRERANLPQLQSDILRNAILACRPGGKVVYSTCTASQQQNEFVVQMTIQQLLHQYGVVCEIEDLTPLTNLLKNHIHFFPDCELGSLALPFLDANFGPAYICKIVRRK